MTAATPLAFSQSAKRSSASRIIKAPRHSSTGSVAITTSSPPMRCQNSIASSDSHLSEFADDLTKRFGGHDHRANVRCTFRLIGIEQLIRCLARQHEFHLPGEIECIADAGREALTEKRRSLMGGIAHKKYPTDPPALREQRVKAIDRRAPYRQVRWIGEFTEHTENLPVLGKLFRAFARQQLGFPSSQGAGSRYVGAGPRRRTILKAFVRALRRIGSERVDHDPLFVERKIGVRDSESFSDEAVCAIARNDVSRCQVFEPAAPLDCECHTLRILLESRHRRLEEKINIAA